MTQPVLLDNTVLTNFALIGRTDFVFDLWSAACTTPAGQAEYQAGIKAHDLPANAWISLEVTPLTPVESAFAAHLQPRLGIGERSCIAVACYRSGLFASDDYDARQQAKVHGIPITGTIGILLLNIQRQTITLAAGNSLLERLIEFGYRSPVVHLDEFV